MNEQHKSELGKLRMDGPQERIKNKRKKTILGMKTKSEENKRKWTQQIISWGRQEKEKEEDV